jgi:putative PEP-CTERM system histidine kinase
VLIFGGAGIILSLLRLRVLKIDIYLSSPLIYNSITVSIIGIYLVAVGILAKLVSYLEIPYPLILEDFFIFLAAFGLAVIILSNRLRQVIKRFISLHLKRPKYDYQKIWATFSQKTASLAGMREICSVVAKISAETFGSACATIWLADPSQEALTLGGSTVFSPDTMPDLAKDGEAAAQFTRSMRDQPELVDFDEKGMDWAGELRRSLPEFFEHARIRYAISLHSGDEFLGIMTLDEKITKEDFSWEDSDLLKAIAGQAAVNLFKIKMSQQLSAAREMEAFKTMSAFFLHDLKNLASKLSLTMENLPVHYDNPEFRNDALKAIADSVGKINKMCGGLSLLRQEIRLQEVEADLNELVVSTLGKMNGSKATIAQDLKQVAKVHLDLEQMQKVLTNLILNAHEAVENGGEIRVATGQRDGWAVLSISDNGCGMSGEFIEKSLFRPFKTTKKKGMGIGLYHSKTIIEAHHGRIEVESEEGKGTTFRILLPSIEKKT